MRPETEPLTVTADTVAEYLRGRGQEQSAALVVHLSERATEANRREAYLTKRLDELAAQLGLLGRGDRPRDYTPPPEASD